MFRFQNDGSRHQLRLFGVASVIAFASIWLPHVRGLPVRAQESKPATTSVRTAPSGSSSNTEVLPVAAVITVYRPNSHADVILGKILNGYPPDGSRGPKLRLVALYADQVPEKEMSRDLAAKHGFRLAKTIDEALTLGTNQLQVSGVFSIGEHGDYPYTPDTKQHMYPRRRFFEEIAATFRRVGKVVPVFNDKHLAYRWEDAKFMHDTAQQLKIPLLAGSSIPVAWRDPAVEPPLDCEIEAALGVGYGGLESYGFHAIEGLQCVIERRRGGESGVKSVQAVRGEAIQQAASDGRWSPELLEAVIKVLPKTAKSKMEWWRRDNSAVYLFEHRDGLKSAVAMANGLSNDFAVAVKLKGKPEPIAVWYHLQDGAPFGHFAYLVHAFEHTMRTGVPAYPAERTLLASGLLDRAMHSLASDSQRYETPELAISYRSTDWPFANRTDSKLILPNTP